MHCSRYFNLLKEIFGKDKLFRDYKSTRYGPIDEKRTFLILKKGIINIYLDIEVTFELESNSDKNQQLVFKLLSCFL